MKHAFVLTESIEGMHGMLPNVRDHDLSIYLKTQGDAMYLTAGHTSHAVIDRLMQCSGRI
jgi:sarcosine dehydrogenase